MDIIDVVEQYIELCIERDNLKTRISDAERDFAYEKIEGDMAYRAGDYNLERGYNTAANNNVRKKQDSENMLGEINQKLSFVYQEYMALIESFSSDEIRDTIDRLIAKKNEIVLKVEELKEKRRTAVRLGDEAFNNRDYVEEKKQNDIVSNIDDAIRKTQPTIEYYDEIISHLSELCYSRGKN